MLYVLSLAKTANKFGKTFICPSLNDCGFTYLQSGFISNILTTCSAEFYSNKNNIDYFKDNLLNRTIISQSLFSLPI